ncbi:MAG: hypothetical protein M1838_005568 [Thelocarpon superellum]|nr:MAG: hypothetical protein M1838_005568 [Thelocarpon superellum]
MVDLGDRPRRPSREAALAADAKPKRISRDRPLSVMATADTNKGLSRDIKTLATSPSSAPLKPVITHPHPPPSPIPRSRAIAISAKKSKWHETRIPTPLTARQHISYLSTAVSSPPSPRGRTVNSDASSSSVDSRSSGGFSTRSLMFAPMTTSSPTKDAMGGSTAATTATSPPARKGHNKNAMKLTSLPRYHPAVYQSPSSSGSGAGAIQSQLLPSDAATRLHQYQRDLANNAVAARTSMGGHRPDSPQLAPLGSPGPVTPLLLEEKDGYLSVDKKAS